jgi:hypothetical protein
MKINESIECVLHVHVEAPESLKVLQELAVILLIYEEEIMRLHPPCRRPHFKKGQDGPRGSTDSNRIFWVIGDSDTTPDRLSKAFQELDRTIAGLKRLYPSIDELRRHVQYSTDNDEADRKRLAVHMNYPPGPEENGRVHIGTATEIAWSTSQLQ